MSFDPWEGVSNPSTDYGGEFSIKLLGSGSAIGLGIHASGGAPSLGPSDDSTDPLKSEFESLSSAGGSAAHKEKIPLPVASDSDPIVVTGQRTQKYLLPDWWYASGGGQTGSGDWITGGSGGGTGDGTSSLPDEASIDVQISFTRTVTPSEQAAINNLKTAIEKITAAIDALADNAILRLPNGADVTGAELKAIWAKTDFTINDDVAYQNGTKGGEANMYFGQPTVSFNIQYLDLYDDSPGGMNYVVAHELGHLSQAGTSYYADQRTANDIARALLNGANLSYLANPGYGYTASAPLQFSNPSSGGSTGGGGHYDPDII